MVVERVVYAAAAGEGSRGRGRGLAPREVAEDLRDLGEVGPVSWREGPALEE